VVLSVALHAAALVAIAMGRGPAPVGPLPLPVLPHVELAPVEITLWNEPVTPPAIGLPSDPPAHEMHGAAVHAPRSAPTAAPIVEPTTAPTGVPVRSLAMRSGADLQVHELQETMKPETPETVAPLTQPAAPDSGEPDPKQKHEAFSMNVEGDGTAHLHDTRNLRWVLGMPTKRGLRARYDDWQETLADAYSGKAHDYCNYPERPIENPVGSIGVTIMKFDVTDWAMRRHGDDPYASAKLAQLDATRAERMQAGARYREKELAGAGALMSRNLEQLWATVPDIAERKRELFALWDECTETGTDDDLEAGMRARARVIAFIREHLPSGSHDAFTSIELAALNRDKQSYEQFAPYAE